jgi:hypothetical protein
MTNEELVAMDIWSLGRLLVDRSNDLKGLQANRGTIAQFNEYSQDIKNILDLLQERGWIEPKP